MISTPAGVTVNPDQSLTIAPTKADMLDRQTFNMTYSIEVYWTEKNLQQVLSKTYEITYVDDCNSGLAEFTLKDMEISVLRPEIKNQTQDLPSFSQSFDTHATLRKSEVDLYTEGICGEIKLSVEASDPRVSQFLSYSYNATEEAGKRFSISISPNLTTQVGDYAKVRAIVSFENESYSNLTRSSEFNIKVKPCELLAFNGSEGSSS